MQLDDVIATTSPVSLSLLASRLVLTCPSGSRSHGGSSLEICEMLVVFYQD